MAKILACKLSELAPGTMRKVEVPGKDEIVVANVGGKVYAMHGLCHHQDGPLADGELEGNVITCPWHGAKWDVTAGKMVDFPIELDDEPTYKAYIEGEDVFVEA